MLERFGEQFDAVGDGAGRTDASGYGTPDDSSTDPAERAREADRAFRDRSDRRPDVSPDGGGPRHVVCVVVDALRADAVDPSLTPFLADLAGGDAISPCTWTFPAVTSMLTGTYPHAHEAMRDTDDFADSVADITGLPEQSSDLLVSEAFAGAGYETYGAFGFVVPFLALEGRFATHVLYDDAAAEDLLADHEAWLTDRHDRRTFSYLHLADLHEPVDPPVAYWEAHDVADVEGVTEWRHEDVVETTPTVDRYRRHRQRLYRAAAEYVDNRLAAHHRRLTDLADGDVLLVVAGDHGEGFWDRARLHAEHFADPRPAYCVGHGGAPYEAVTRVPLRAAGLDVPPDRRTSLVDVAPTLLAAAGIDTLATSHFSAASHFPAAGLDPAAAGEADDAAAHGVAVADAVPDDRPVLVEGCRYGYEKKAVYGDGHKLVVSRGDDVALGLSLPDDRPTDLSESTRSVLRERLPPWPNDTDAPREDDKHDRVVDSDVAERLERLGYK